MVISQLTMLKWIFFVENIEFSVTWPSAGQSRPRRLTPTRRASGQTPGVWQMCQNFTFLMTGFSTEYAESLGENSKMAGLYETFIDEVQK
jgi:hypothetical protein